jgi:hypothetical protein
MALKSANARTARLAAAIYLSLWGVIPPKSGSLVDFAEKPRKNSRFSSAPAKGRTRAAWSANCVDQPKPHRVHRRDLILPFLQRAANRPAEQAEL